LDLDRAFAVLHREFFLWREDQRFPPISREIKDCKSIPDRDPDHAGAIYWIGELEADGYERENHRERSPEDAEWAAIGPLDIGEALAKLDEGERLKEIGEHGTKHCHVEEHTADERAGCLASHGEPHDQHHREANHATSNERNVRGLVRAVGDRQEMREEASARQ